MVAADEVRVRDRATDVYMEEPERPLRPQRKEGNRGLARLRRTRPEHWLFVVVLLFLLYLAGSPVGFLLRQTFIVDGQLTLTNVSRMLSDPQFWPLLANTLILATFSPLISITLGTVLAYLYVRTNVPFKSLLFAGSIMPLAIPAIIYGIAWVFLLSPRIGLFNVWASALTGGPIYDIFSMGGMVVVGALNTVPLVFLLMYAAFRAADPSLEESALMSGAGKFQVFLRVSLPLVRPALAAVLLLKIVKALEAFEVPAVLGVPAGEYVLTSRIYLATGEYPVDYGTIGAQSLLLVVVIAFGVYVLVSKGRMGRGGETVSGKGFRPKELDLGRWRWPLSLIIIGFVLLAVVAPLGILLYASFQPFYSAPSLEGLSRLSWSNYADVIDSRLFARSAWNSLVLSVGAATVASVVATFAAWLVIKARLRGKSVIELLIYTPMAVPGIVMGVSLIILYLRLPLPVYGTRWILLIAYVTLFMPYAFQYVSSSMYQISGELEEAAYMSGAGWGSMFRRIVFPLLIPGLLASWLFVFINAARELGSSILLYSPGTEVLPVQLWQLWAEGQFGQTAALGIMMVVALLLVAATLRVLENRFSAYSAGG